MSRRQRLLCLAMRSGVLAAVASAFPGIAKADGTAEQLLAAAR